MGFFSRIFGKDGQAKESAGTPVGQQISNEEEQLVQVKAAEWLQKGEQCYELKDYDNAVAAFTEAITLNPKCWEAHFVRGKTYYMKHKVTKALRDLESALLINPKHIGSLHVRGLIHAGENQYDKAIDSFSQLISIDPEHKEAYYQLGCAYMKKPLWDKAIDNFNQLLSLDENNEIAYYERGMAYVAKEQFEKAINDFNKAISLKSDNACFYFLRALTYLELNRPEDAVKDLKTACDMGDEEACEKLKTLRGEKVTDCNDPKMTKKVFSVDMNRGLWRDPKAFEIYLRAEPSFRRAFSQSKPDQNVFLETANMLDDMMQNYEKKYGPIEDPLFYWHFATANAFFLQIDKKLDGLGSVRIGYVVNGYKEGLNKHLLYPSYTAEMLETAFENIPMFGNEHDKKWAITNRDKFTPISR